jgi:hypothetical protein
MAIRTKRRARFRRATSGTQNLTTLIYNILKEQQASRKAALLAAFDANMRNANYESTYGGEPVNVDSVVAFYEQMIQAYPEGTTERDRLSAELAEFRVSSADKILSVYGDAYNNGTYAFGEKVDLKSYLAFLRESKAAAPDEATKMKYTSEEFIVNFNDVHDDMKARSASAGSLSTFYRRQLKVAEEMGITKDSKTYRNIQSYLATASKQAAADAKQDLRDKANKIIVRRAGLMSNALEKAVEAAQREGRITNEEAQRFYESGSLPRVKIFFGLDATKQGVILAAAARAGVTLGEQPLTGSALYDLAYNTKDELRLAIGDPNLNAADRTFFKDLATSWDNEIIRPAGLYNDVERATDSGVDLVNDSANALGNPSANVAAYRAHSRRLSEGSAAETAGSAVISILNGEVPFPDEFGGKTMISELTPMEVTRLSELYSGELFVSGAPADLINQIAQDYLDDEKIRSGAGYSTIVINDFGTPEVVVTDQAPSNRVPFFYSTTLSDGTVVNSLAMQQKSVVSDQNGKPVGEVIFDIDDNGNVKESFITNDGYKVDLDIMENWLVTNGVNIFRAENGQYAVDQFSVAVVPGTQLNMFSGAALQANSSFSQYANDVWDGTAGGPGKALSRNETASRIAANITIGGSTSDLFGIGSIDVGGNNTTREGGSQITVKNDLESLRELGIGRTEFDALMSGDGGKMIREAVGSQLFRRQEAIENRAALGQPIDQSELDQLRYRGAQAAADYERAVSAPPPPNPFSTGLGSVPDFTKVSPEGPRQSRLEDLSKVKSEQERLRVMAKTESDYFFRYSQMSAPSEMTPGDSARSSYTGSSLGAAPSFKASVVRPSFTPAQVEKSLIDFRAGERAPLNISPSTATSR